MSTIRPKLIAAFLLCLVLHFFVGCEKKPAEPEAQKSILRLATTTSTVDSGLMGILIPIFESKYIWSIVEDITERKLAWGEIKQHLDELQRWHDVMLGRQDRNSKLKREVNELLEYLGKSVRYPSAVESK